MTPNAAPSKSPLILWNSDDCAAFLRCSRRRFMEHIRPLPSFPPPRYLPTVEGSSRPLWFPDEVEMWAAANLSEHRQPITRKRGRPMAGKIPANGA